MKVWELREKLTGVPDDLDVRCDDDDIETTMIIADVFALCTAESSYDDSDDDDDETDRLIEGVQ